MSSDEIITFVNGDKSSAMESKMVGMGIYIFYILSVIAISSMFLTVLYRKVVK
ncbi:hypothetical protein JBKA6_0146 [Ichthyobacterium seriolicida]|uniref:Uncharacterized protein n=2 Tax=Ichthyobacterium seriolicida TaxID=242600 RepID=A0A1J1DWB7_9FLAO|nr:hypothetical protein JBKA6_0146 [Ichthyobacterium seriolicida]